MSRYAGLTAATIFAAGAHNGQVDKAGEPYIYHLARVSALGKTANQRIVGMLHDVLEDTSTTEEDLKHAGFSPVVRQAVALVTRDPDTTYRDFIELLATSGNQLARMVKLFDLQDHVRKPHDAIPESLALRYSGAIIRIVYGYWPDRKTELAGESV